MLTTIRDFITENITGQSSIATNGILLLLTALAAIAFYYITRFLLAMLEKLIMRSPTEWDDDLITPRFLKSLSQIAPAICVRWLLPSFFGTSEGMFRFLSSVTSLYILVCVVMTVIIFLSNLRRAMAKRDNLRRYAVKGIFQMLKIIAVCIGTIIGISIVMSIPPTVILTSLGASAAVLMLVFKDTILGLVASVQLTANKMLKEGDWIISEAHNANGEVIDVSLTTIKVRNWDNSVSTIPPYSLVSESFRNYQAMKESGGRRVDRSFYIDADSIRFLTREEIDSLAAEGWLDGIDTDPYKTVNFGLLRRYLEIYLRNHPALAGEKTLMVRQMAPTPSGLPLQLYFFTRTTVWEEYEKIQSDVFDHVYAVVSRFGLRVFQTPAGTDIARANPAISQTSLS